MSMHTTPRKLNKTIALLLAATALLASNHPPGMAQVYQVPPSANPQAAAQPTTGNATDSSDLASENQPAEKSQIKQPAPETIDIDVSTRSVAVTSAFTGTEIIVFGAISGTRKELAAANAYDIVIIVEGTYTPLTARRKSNVGGLWINTRSMQFESVPSYYAIASTQPVDNIAVRRILRDNQIGFDHVLMRPSAKQRHAIGPNELAAFRKSVTRLKQKERLYIAEDTGVEFIGDSLFRSEIRLPANVPVGPLATRVYLFNNGELLAKSGSMVTMQRQGFERFIHDLAFERPLLYGLMTVFLAAFAGLAASAAFRNSKT